MSDLLDRDFSLPFVFYLILGFGDAQYRGNAFLEERITVKISEEAKAFLLCHPSSIVIICPVI